VGKETHVYVSILAVLLLHPLNVAIDGYELILITMATFTQALAGSAPGLNIIGVLIFWRFLMGVGVGGDYPLSALITSEFASTHIRGRLMAAVFACQGWGNLRKHKQPFIAPVDSLHYLVASLVALVVVFAYKTPLQQNQNACEPTVIEPMWRLLIGLGCVPGVAAMYFRLTISETPRFTMDIEHNVQQASEDINQFLDLGTSYADPDAVIQARSKTSRYSIRGFLAYYSTWANAKVLLGTSWSWLATDVGVSLPSYKVFRLISPFRSPFTDWD
jgi:PHS family inorganic phosphate transporter-like MFS transporter